MAPVPISSQLMTSIEIWIPLPDSTRTSALSDSTGRFTTCGDTLMSHLALLSTDGAQQRKWLRPRKAGHQHKQKMNEYVTIILEHVSQSMTRNSSFLSNVIKFWWWLRHDRQVVSLWVVMDRVDMLAPLKDIHRKYTDAILNQQNMTMPKQHSNGF